MRKRCLALVTLMVMLASMVLPCAAMAFEKDHLAFVAPISVEIHDSEVPLPQAYHIVSDRSFYYIGEGRNNEVVDPAWKASRIITSGEYTYYLLDDDTAALIAIDQTYQSKRVVIPSEIDGHTVTRLGLDRNVDVLEVYYSSESHGSWNGSNLFLLFGTNVEEVVLPESVSVIGYLALSTDYQGGIKKLIAPGVVDYGGGRCVDVAFKLPDKIERISYFAFSDGRFSAYKNKLKLPETLVEIGACAFKNSSLREVTLPGSVQVLGPYTFTNCTSLQTVTLKNGVPYISDGMFMNCKKLKQISLPESIASVGAYAFENCEKLSKVTFAKKAQVASIGEGAFRGCAALKSVVIPEGVTEIGDVAFFDCSALSAVTLPDSLTSIGAHAFDGCSSKVKFTVVDGSYAHKWATDNGFATKVQKRK